MADPYSRRKFLGTLGKAAGTSMIMTVPGIGLAAESSTRKTAYTVKEVIDTIQKAVPNFKRPVTVDQLRSGSLEQAVTGIVTTMFPTMTVIEKTKKAGANFIIAHETPFYNNNDETAWLKNDDAYHYKTALLDKYKIAIWRFHDHWHDHQPDGIAMGNLIRLGWEQYYNPATPRLLTLPRPMTIKAIATLVKEKLGISMVRIAGDLQQECRTVYLAFGYMDPRMQIAAIEQSKPDLILGGETREWETVERVRDGLLMGEKTSLMVLGHAVSEEAGMEYAAKWLEPMVPGVAITHIPSGNPFIFF